VLIHVLFLNYSKCHQNDIGSSSSDRQWWLLYISHPITIVNSERDLGVTFDSNLKFTDHINQIVQKANCVLGLIKCTFIYL